MIDSSRKTAKMTLLYEFYYTNKTISRFTNEWQKEQGLGQTISVYAQSILFQDQDCTQPIDDSSIIVEANLHSIDNVIQPYISEIAIFLLESHIETTSVRKEFNFLENVPYVYQAILKTGKFKCAKQVLFTNIGNGIRRIQIVQ